MEEATDQQLYRRRAAAGCVRPAAVHIVRGWPSSTVQWNRRRQRSGGTVAAVVAVREVLL